MKLVGIVWLFPTLFVGVLWLVWWFRGVLGEREAGRRRDAIRSALRAERERVSRVVAPTPVLPAPVASPPIDVKIIERTGNLYRLSDIPVDLCLGDLLVNHLGSQEIVWLDREKKELGLMKWPRK